MLVARRQIQHGSGAIRLGIVDRSHTLHERITSFDQLPRCFQNLVGLANADLGFHTQTVGNEEALTGRPKKFKELNHIRTGLSHG
jgi:hypothetical protein